MHHLLEPITLAWCRAVAQWPAVTGFLLLGCLALLCFRFWGCWVGFLLPKGQEMVPNESRTSWHGSSGRGGWHWQGSLLGSELGKDARNQGRRASLVCSSCTHASSGLVYRSPHHADQPCVHLPILLEPWTPAPSLSGTPRREPILFRCWAATPQAAEIHGLLMGNQLCVRTHAAAPLRPFPGGVYAGLFGSPGPVVPRLLLLTLPFGWQWPNNRK